MCLGGIVLSAKQKLEIQETIPQFNNNNTYLYSTLSTLCSNTRERGRK